MKTSLMLMGILTTAGIVFADTPTGWWTGGGTTFSTLDEANWEGGKPDGGTISFAKGGSRAELGEDLTASSLVFDTPDSVPSFTLAPLSSAPTAKLLLSGGITQKKSESGVAHTNTIAVPVEAPAGSTLTLNVQNADDGLVFDAPIARPASATSGSVKLNTTGKGKYFFNAKQGTGAYTVLNGGTVYFKGGAVGSYLQSNPTSAPLYIHFAGGTNDVSFTYTRTGGYDFSIFFDSDTTNVVGYTQMQSGYGTPYNYMTNSRTVFTGTYAVRNPCWRMLNNLYADAEVVFKGTINGKDQGGTTSEYAMHCNAYNTTSARRGRMVFAMPRTNKSIVKEGLFLAGPLTARFDTDFAFDTNSKGDDTPLSLMYNEGKPMGVIVDLNGHSQRFGALRTPPASTPYGWENYTTVDWTAYMTSAVPATVYVRQNGWENGSAWTPRFEGALSFVKEGSETLSLSGASGMTGRLEVAEGRLALSGDNGSMRKISGVTVSGGTLAIDRKNRLPDKTEYRFSGGKLEIAAGVRLRASAVYVSDGDGGWVEETGVLTAATHPNLISGEGSLSAKPGLCLILR